MDTREHSPKPARTSQTQKTVFYSAYGQFDDDVLAQVRRDTYGEDIGQFSWITADEFRRFFRLLKLDSSSTVVDLACGSGGPAMFMAQTTGCRVIGIDINESGIDTATRLARERGLQDRVRFVLTDAGQPLPVSDESCDAIVSIDAMNHLPNRAEIFADWYRVLRPGGRFLFTDATIVTGTLSRDEILARGSSMGLFLFTPAGMYDHLITEAGFIDLNIEDVTETIASVSKKWHDAREQHRESLIKAQSESEFQSLQQMLAAAHKLASERRLSRFAYFGRKPV